MQDLTIPISEAEYLFMSRPTRRGYWIMDMELGIYWRMIVLSLSGGLLSYDGMRGADDRQMEMLNIFMGVCLLSDEWGGRLIAVRTS